MSEFPWPNLENPNLVCGTSTDYDEAKATWLRLAKLITVSGKAQQYGVFLEEYGNVWRVVLKDRLAEQKIRKARKERRSRKRAGLCQPSP
ncbi:hypothetical protein ACFWAN_32445 [Streptomyces mirabilis]|uniref:hypothetical protein n=1 Tax=Streptomyces mirabilis TaxID=68239 RepID=UPI0036650169